MPPQIDSCVLKSVRAIGVEPKPAIAERAKQAAATCDFQLCLYFPNSLYTLRAIHSKEKPQIRCPSKPPLVILARAEISPEIYLNFLPRVVVIHSKSLAELVLRATANPAATALLGIASVVPIQPDAVLLAIVGVALLVWRLGHVS